MHLNPILASQVAICSAEALRRSANCEDFIYRKTLVNNSFITRPSRHRIIHVHLHAFLSNGRRN